MQQKKSIVASMYQRKKVYVYDFATNVVPGQSVVLYEDEVCLGGGIIR